MDQSKELTAASIGSFVAQYVKGDIPHSIKSEPVPISQDGPVYVVVADSFEDVVYDKEKDVLLEIYAPWCAHCNQLAPIYEKLALSLRSNPHLVIAKMDGTENDLPLRVPFQLTAFPTIKFFKAAKNDEEKQVISFEGFRTLEGLLEFVQENGSYKVEIDESEIAKKTEQAEEDEEVEEVEEDEDDDKVVVHDEL